MTKTRNDDGNRREVREDDDDRRQDAAHTPSVVTRSPRLVPRHPFSYLGLTARLPVGLRHSFLSSFRSGSRSRRRRGRRPVNGRNGG